MANGVIRLMGVPRGQSAKGREGGREGGREEGEEERDGGRALIGYHWLPENVPSSTAGLRRIRTLECPSLR